MITTVSFDPSWHSPSDLEYRAGDSSFVPVLVDQDQDEDDDDKDQKWEKGPSLVAPLLLSGREKARIVGALGYNDIVEFSRSSLVVGCVIGRWGVGV